MQCSICGDNHGKYPIYHSRKHICGHCMLALKYVYYKGKAYNRGSNMLMQCANCGAYTHKKQIDSSHGYPLCNTCLLLTHKEKLCTYCGEIHEKGNCYGLKDIPINNGNREIGRGDIGGNNESYSFSARGTMRDGETKKLPIQKEGDLPPHIIKYLNRFYDKMHKFEKYNIPNIPLDIKSSIDFVDETNITRMQQTLMTRLNNDRLLSSEGGKSTKYAKMYYYGITDGVKALRKYIDNKGNLKELKESINIFNKAHGLTEVKLALRESLTYRLSNDLQHKFDGFVFNESIATCQRRSNNTSYARGGYDFITNGSHLALLIYKDSKLIGRCIVREMEKSGTIYYIVDRMYGTFSSALQQAKIFEQILLDLKSKGLNVGVTNYGAHQKSVYNFLKGIGINLTKTITDLYQSPRKLYGTGTTGYYCDGGTEIIKYKDHAQEYLKKAYLF